MQQPTDGQDAGEWQLSGARARLVGFIIAVAVAGAAYRFVYSTGLQRTAALYVGVPAILAICLALFPASRSATATLLKGATLALLIAGIILPEGLLCLLFAAPTVIGVAVLVGVVIDAGRDRKRRQGPTLMMVALPLLVMSAEGVVGSPFDSRDAATATVEVTAPPEAVAAALARPPRFTAELPFFLTLGFNRPVGATGAGIAVGDRRVIDFAGGTHDDHPLRLIGLTGERSVDHHAPMHLTVVESRPGRVVFTVDRDDTMLSRWVDLDRAVVTWAATGTGTTRVSWTLEYERLLSPTAYFAALQRYGMDRAAGYLLDAVIVEPRCMTPEAIRTGAWSGPPRCTAGQRDRRPDRVAGGPAAGGGGRRRRRRVEPRRRARRERPRPAGGVVALRHGRGRGGRRTR